MAYRLESNASLIRLLQHFSTPFFEQNIFGVIWIGFGLILYPFLYLIGARKAFRIDPRYLAYIVFPWLYFLVFALPNPLIFRWYLTPPLPPYFLFILFGLEKVLTDLLSKIKYVYFTSKWQGAILFFFCLLLPTTSTLSEWRLHPDHGPDRPAPQMAWIKLELLYRQAADRITSQIQPGQVLAAGDVGVLGYYTKARILDTVGLNSPQSLQYYPLGPEYYVINYAIPTSLILEEKPDWIIILDVYGRLTLLSDKEFLKQYRLIDTIPTDIYGSQGMLIFKKNPD